MIFLTTVKTGDNFRVRALENQFLEDGTPVLTDLSVQCDKKNRADQPLNSIFVVDKLMYSQTFYLCSPKTIIPLADPNGVLLPNVSKEQIAAYEKYLRDNPGLFKPHDDDADVKKPRRPRLLDNIRAQAKYNPPTIEDDGFFVDPDIWYLLVRNTIRKTNTLVVSDSGLGKTELVELVTNKMGRTFKEHDMSAMQDPVSSLLGVHRFVNGESVFDYSPFVTDIACADTNILFDELSRAPSSAYNILFPCLDRRRHLHIGIADSRHERKIDVDKEVCFFATANLGGEYTGTHMVDRALLDRFMIIKLPYLQKQDEIKLLTHRCGCDLKEASAVVSVAHDMRQLFFNGDLSSTVSTRYTIMVGDLIKDGMNILQSFTHAVLPLFDGTDSSGERATALAVIKKY